MASALSFSDRAIAEFTPQIGKSPIGLGFSFADLKSLGDELIVKVRRDLLGQPPVRNFALFLATPRRPWVTTPTIPMQYNGHVQASGHF